MNITTVRTGIKTALTGLTNIRIEAHVPLALEAPCVVIYPESIRYSVDYENQADMTVVLQVIIPGAANAEGAQELLDSLLNPSGNASIPGILASHQNLGGAASSIRLIETRNYGTLEKGPQLWWTADIVMDVYE